ncbi:MAG: replicative DNA helicase [Paludibacteraceae bacterium]|nr:replicative DNA helicase [Bacteroidales bacterium]MDD5990554.1 replicative DNA helicase [Paludibacteraceae bacterium]MDD6747388.1 replicative DNA helicase [Paludibacteraceae bacterium]MDY5651485.1 replicative DNA helicase [Paludibacteraceae bacterium]
MAVSNKNSKRSPQTTIIKVGANEMGKLPPQAQELEDSVLGALMIEKEAFGTVADLLRPEVFYKDQNRLVFEAIRELAVNDQPIDILSVGEKLKSKGTLEKAGGAVYLADLTRRVASTAHLHYHAEIIAKKATARDLISMAAQIEEKAFDETQDIDDLMQEAEAGIFEITQRSQKRSVTQVDSVIEEAFARMEKAAKNTGNISGIPSGFHALDKITSGWQTPDLIIIAARPAMGKTAFVLSMAKNIAVDRGIPTAIFSLEMSNVQLVNRLIMNVCELEGDKIKTGKMSKEDKLRLNTKINIMKGKPLYMDDTPSLSIYELRSKARKLVNEHGVKLIIIDYLQLMNAQGSSFGSREQEVSIISRGLKGLAKELDIPIIALSQLNRGVEARTGIEGKTPQLSDLRESGAIEQDADMVCFIHRPEYYRIFNDEKSGKDLRGLAQIIVAKHRNGATDSIWLRFRGKYAKFQNEDDAFDSNELDGPMLPDSGAVTISSSMNSPLGAVSFGQQLNPDGASINSLGENIAPAF